mmetsp:Transcript_18922/g.49484  ORF Transcript_18922/g.49484 Transcript_18922/m.49484 type:complete len:475 (-) Transcript_18922:87-1511(-)|eukprot:jgi/Tetstr1/458086/TSEL_044593.t1
MASKWGKLRLAPVEQSEVTPLSPIAPSPAARSILKPREEGRYTESYEEMLARTTVQRTTFNADQYDDFDNEEDEDDDDEILRVRGNKSTFDAKMFSKDEEVDVRLRWNVTDLGTLSMVSSGLAIMATGVLPLVDHFIWYHYDLRMTEITVTYWMAALAIGGLGMWAAHKKIPMLLAIHVAFGYMLGICLGAFAVSVYYDMESRCEVVQAAYVGCAGCRCSWTNECTVQDFAEIGACKTCQAWPVEVCRNVIIGLGNGMTLTSIMGLLAVIFTSVPVTANLMMMVRMENAQGEAFKSKIGLDVVELEHQIALLSKGAEPSVRPSALDLLIGRVRDRGMADLADNARAAFNVYQAIKRGPPPTLKSMAKAVTAPRMGILADQISRAKGNKGLQHFDALASGHADEDSDFEELEPATYLTPKPSGPKPRDPSARPGSTASNRPGSAASGVASLGDWDMSRYDNSEREQMSRFAFDDN